MKFRWWPFLWSLAIAFCITVSGMGLWLAALGPVGRVHGVLMILTLPLVAVGFLIGALPSAGGLLQSTLFAGGFLIWATAVYIILERFGRRERHS